MIFACVLVNIKLNETSAVPCSVVKGLDDSIMRRLVFDNGGRRAGIDRRQFSYAIHIPERRSVEDRRSGLDRRLEARTSES